MFDANAAHIPVGQLFFAEVHSTNKALEKLGVKQGDIILCKHILKFGRENKQTVIWVTNDSSPRIYFDSKNNDDWSWLVYSGRPNGNGFINDYWKAKALEFLGGSWSQDYTNSTK